MADIHLTQSEAEALIAMEKHRLDDERYAYPTSGSLVVPLQSPDKREQFLLDIRRGRIDLLKGKSRRAHGKSSFWCGWILAVRRIETRTTRRSEAPIFISIVKAMGTSGQWMSRLSTFRGHPTCGARWKISCDFAVLRCRRTLNEGCSHDPGYSKVA